MSVIVKGFDKPKSCDKCWLYDCPYAYAAPERVEELQKNIQNGTLPEWCGLEAIKTPHGRCVDADAFDEHMRKTSRYFDTHFDLKEMPTIIEAED